MCNVAEQNEELGGSVFTSPLPFLFTKDANTVHTLNTLLPYSIGIEVECGWNEDIADHEELFQKIPYAMDVNTSSREKRIRIPNGLSGIFCLYFTSLALKRFCLLNPLSGIHYHVDCTEVKDFTAFSSFMVKQSDYILSELDTWGYKGNYNKKKVDNTGGFSWVRNNIGHHTMEFRIGEMTFDYSVLIKRILHVSAIIQNVKRLFGCSSDYVYSKYDPNIALSYMEMLYCSPQDVVYKKRSEELTQQITHFNTTIVSETVSKNKNVKFNL